MNIIDRTEQTSSIERNRLVETPVMASSPSRAWITSCGTLGTVIVAYGCFGNRESPGDLAYLIGYNLPIAAILGGGLLHVCFRKRKAARTSWYGILAVYVTLIAGSLMTSNRERTEFRKAAVSSGPTKAVASMRQAPAGFGHPAAKARRAPQSGAFVASV